jgi:hypothetical protein
MKKIIFSFVLVLLVCSIGLAGVPQSQGSLVVSSNSQQMAGFGGLQGQATLAGTAQSQNQNGWGWSQKQSGGSAVGQAQLQGGGFGYKTQGQDICADIGQEQKLNTCRPDKQSQNMTLEGQQGEKQVGSGGFQLQANGAVSGQAQNQGSWGRKQTQGQVGAVVQIEGQKGGCFGTQTQGQQAGVYAGQTQSK